MTEASKHQGPATALRIAVLGAESTGKTTLAQSLVQSLVQSLANPAKSAPGVRCAWVPELLRQWCDQHGRTPLQHEQGAIAQAQQAQIEAAAATHDIVVCDTTPLMTAVYSQFVFGDASLLPLAVAWQARIDLTLLTALDLPWVADGLQRDGPQVQRPVDDLLRQALLQAGLPFAVVGGQGPERLAQALAACGPLLRGLLTEPITTTVQPASTPSPSNPSSPPDCENARPSTSSPARWRCECCGEADFERAMRRLSGIQAQASASAP